MTALSMFSRLFGLKGCGGRAAGQDEMRREVRKTVHDSRNASALAIATARRAEHQSNRIAVIAEDVIRTLARSRQEDGHDAAQDR